MHNLNRAKDSKLSSRMLKMMSDIKNFDSTGQRLVRLGITTAEEKPLLKGFDLNINAPLQSILYAPHTVDTATGVILIANLIPKKQLIAPDNATHVIFRSAFINLDLETGIIDSSKQSCEQPAY